MSANDSIITVLADCWNSSILRPDLNTSASGVTAQTVENAIYAASFSFAIVLFGYIIFLVRVPRKRLIPFRVSAVAHYNKSAEGKVIEIFQAICSIGSCILFVAEGYEYPPVPDFYLIFELIFTSFFLVQYFLSLYMSENKVRYIFSFMALVDVVTIFPVYYLLGTGLANADSPGFGFLRFSRVVKFLRVLRLLRSMRVSKAAQGSQVETVIVGQFINIGAKVVSLLIITAGLVQFVAEMLNQCWDGNREYGQQFKFHDALYFTVVTLTTVGYGDIAPLTAVGRMLVIIVITVGLVWLPSELGKLSSLMKLKPPYSGSFKVNTEDRHVVVCSDENFNGVLDFLEEFYHPDHGFSTVKVCLMSPGLPTDELKNLLLEHQSDLRLSFIRGDPISTVDLGRARMEKAEACFLLTNKFHKNSDEQDSITVLRALAVKNYAPDMKTFVQIIEPENQKHIIAAGVQPHHIVCVDELKMGIIGLTCACPGFATLIANLISSSGDVPKSVQLDPWQQEYSSGLSQEIYHVDLAVFQGMTYKDALLSIYEKLGIMLFALEVKAKFGNVREVVIKPRMDYTIQKGDIGFVIAEDSEVTFIIDSAAPPEQREKYGMSDDKKKKKKGHKKGSQVLPDSPRKGGKGEDKGKDGEGEEKSSGTTGETIGVEGAVNGEGGSGEVEEVEGRGGTYEEGRRKLEPLNHVASISDTKQDKEGKEKMQEAGSKKEMDSARNGGGEVEIMEVNSVSATGGRIPSLNFSSLRKSGSEIKGKAGTKVASFASPVVTGKDVPSASKALAELQEYEDFFTSAEGGEVPQVFVGADSGHQVENIIETVYEKALRKDGKELLRRTLLVLLRDHYDFDLERITVDFVSLTHSLKMKEMEVIDAAAKEAAERANYSARAPISGRSLRSARTKERLR
uniref:RCK N-terminal domain-containing protein n=1 Tax=Palpitomonas bilix TaxID=652834 RepID=A0A7S3D5A0_9EUKA|mmetsp:Transcript_22780/g.58019  ORF Transcript_22780/g.58019 Transcript_22780/m.58019 type:complete len:908 (+) Transcript_22780:406-3129(+)